MFCLVLYLDLALHAALLIFPFDHHVIRHHISIPPPAPVGILVRYDFACKHLGLHHTATQRAKTNPETRL